MAITPFPGDDAGRGSATPRWIAALGGLVAVAAALRLAASGGAPWIDEIFSVGLAQFASGPWDILVGINHDNNHVFNTLWLRLAGDAAPAWVLRLPSVAAGSLAVLLLVLWRSRACRVEGLVAGGLGAASILMVQYGSEARGYALATCLTYAMLLVLRRAEGSGRWGAAAGVWLLVLGGLLAHLSFVFVAAGAIAWGALRAAWSMDRAALALFARIHAVPALTIAALWFGRARDMTIGGGVPNPGTFSAIAALSHVAGGPSEGAGAWTLAALVAIMALGGLAVMALRREADAGLIVIAGVVIPGATVLLLHPPYLVPRYFLLPCALAFAPLAALVAEGLARGGRLRIGAAAGLALLIASNLVADARLILVGRGDAGAALRLIRASAAGESSVTVGADNDFRLGVNLWYYRRELTGLPRLTPAPGSAAVTDPPDFLLTEDFRPRAAAAPEITIRGGARYELMRTFPHDGLSGITWGVYRRRDGS